MTAEELVLDETRAWLVRAHRDIRSADVLIAAEMHAEALFHCQQALEKALKAFLAFHQRPFRKTHELKELAPDILAIEASLQVPVEQADALSKYAWRFRYPGELYEPDAAEAAQVLLQATEIVRAIESRLPATA